MSPRRLPRLIRLRYRMALRRLERDTPDWMRWLTPWGTSLLLHALVLLFILAIVGFHHELTRSRWDSEALSLQLLPADFTALRPSDDLDLSSDLMASTVVSLPSVSSTVARTVAEDPARNLVPARPTLPAGLLKSRGSTGTGRGEGPSPSFAGRRGPSKLKLVKSEGGTDGSEKAVQLGLQWLARHQRPDGGWSLDTSPYCRDGGCPPRPSMVSDTAATGLAILPFLAAGNVHNEPGPYQQVVRAGLKWLVKNQQRDGSLFRGGAFNSAFYSHAIATMALCEAYGMTGDKSLREPAEKAIRFIVLSQNKFDGGWRYTIGMAGDTSVFGWELFALRSASLAGLGVPKGTIRRCREYLDHAATDKSKITYAYRPGGAPTPTMTAEGLVVRQYLGWRHDHPSLVQGVALIDANLEGTAERNIYYTYYAMQLLHNMKGPHWEEWNPRVRDTFVLTQIHGDGCDQGSWDPLSPDPDVWGMKAGRLYVTSLSLLTLEIYYRYLPLYRDEDGGYADTASEALVSQADRNP